MTPVLIYAMTLEEANTCARAHGLTHEQWRYVWDLKTIMGVERGTTIWLVGNYLQCADAHAILYMAMAHDLTFKKIPIQPKPRKHS